MKVIPIALAAHKAQSTTTLATLLMLTSKRDATRKLFFTSHDEDIPFGGDTYSAINAFDPSAAATKSELNVDDAKAVGMLDSDGMTADDIEAGDWDGALIEMRSVNWASPTDGGEWIRCGEIGEVQRKNKSQFTAEIRGLMAKFANNVCRIISDVCDVIRFGDARCGKDPAPFTFAFTVTSVGADPRRQFTASGLAQATNYFTYGDLDWTGGDNALRSMEVKQHTSGGIFELAIQMGRAIQVGDTGNVVAGCNRLLKTGPDEYLGDCKVKFANAVNFRGWPEVAGFRYITRTGSQ